MKEADDSILVSVIMPAYNAEKYIAQAIESVLIQKVPLELLIIDDCSKDATANIVEKYTGDSRVVLVKNKENLGVAETRNTGIRMAKGKYIAFLDADDWWSEGKLEEQCAVLKKTGMVLCCTGRALRKADGSETGKYIGVPECITYKMLLRTNYIPCSSVVMEKKVAQEFYMCHEELHEDYILWLKVLEKYKKVCGIDKPYLQSRLSVGGKSRNKLKSARMQFGVYRLMKFGWIKSVTYFIMYMFHGVRKYM